MKKFKLLILLLLSMFLIACTANKKIEPIEEEKVVKLGIDNIDEHLELFAGKKVGLITNPTGINSNYVSSIDVLFNKVNLVSLFAPEHGIRGDKQAGVSQSTYTDKKTGLPVYSLYGSTLKPTKAMRFFLCHKFTPVLFAGF